MKQDILDIFWLKDGPLEDIENPSSPEEIVEEIKDLGICIGFDR